MIELQPEEPVSPYLYCGKENWDYRCGYRDHENDRKNESRYMISESYALGWDEAASDLADAENNYAG